MSFLSKNDEFQDFQLTSVLIRKFEQKFDPLNPAFEWCKCVGLDQGPVVQAMSCR